MVQRLTNSGDGVELVNAKAGTGKTFALRVARMAWERAGFQVVGATLAARAARQLRDEAGIQACTIARLPIDLEDPHAPGLAADTVVVIDEGSMVGTRQLALILWHAEHVRAKVVLVGVTQQLPEIDAGGAFRGLWEWLGGIELAHNRRQHQPWERQALDLLRAGDAAAAISHYHQHGRVGFRHRATALRLQLVADWWAAMQQPGEQPPPLMLAARRADVDELNRHARQLMAAQGRLGPDCLEVRGQQFARRGPRRGAPQRPTPGRPQRHPRHHHRGQPQRRWTADPHRRRPGPGPATLVRPRPPTTAGDPTSGRATQPPATRPKGSPPTAASPSPPTTSTRSGGMSP